MAGPDDTVLIPVARKTRDAIKDAARKSESYDAAIRRLAREGGLLIPDSSASA